MDNSIIGCSRARLAAAAVSVIVLALLLRRFIYPAAVILFQAAGLALASSPLCRLYEKKLGRSASSLLAVVTALLLLFLMAASLPAAIRVFTGNMGRVGKAVSSLLEKARKLSALYGIDAEHITGLLSSRAASLAGSAADSVSGFISGIARSIIAAAACFFMLRDRDRILLAMELALPVKIRLKAVTCAVIVYEEIMLYLRAQLFIALCVGVLSAAGLAAVGVPGGTVLGLTAGMLNLVPYIGPAAALVPVVISASSEGTACMLAAAGVMLAVQQIDGLVISPRVMGNVTGFSAASVMICLYCAGTAWGVAGILLALPAMITLRTCARVFVELRRTD